MQVMQQWWNLNSVLTTYKCIQIEYVKQLMSLPASVENTYQTKPSGRILEAIYVFFFLYLLTLKVKNISYHH